MKKSKQIKHSANFPERWRVSVDQDRVLQIIDERKYCIAAIHLTGIKKNDEKDLENATLIASAPDLLNALIKWRNESQIPAPSYVLAAIDKSQLFK